MREYPNHEDLGLDPESDQTEDLRPGQRNALSGAANTAEGDQNHLPTHEQES